MDWKEKLRKSLLRWTFKETTDFISTEIIEKLIAEMLDGSDIPDGMSIEDIRKGMDDLKKSLRNKWL
jgi:hypothetical protein